MDGRGATTRRDLLPKSAGVDAVGIAGLAGFSGSGGDEPVFEAGCEGGLGDWQTGAAIGPEVDVSGAEAASGDRSLRIWNRGDCDHGVTWAVHRVPIQSGDSSRIEVSGRFWSGSESFTTIRHSLMRPGPEPPETEEEFPQPGLNTTDLGETPYGGLRDALWLADGRRECAFEWTTPELSTDTAYLAVGTASREADATHDVDDRTVRVEGR